MTLQTMRFYAFGPFRFDTIERVLVRDGTPVPLAPKATEILLVLVEQAGHLVEKDALINRVWPEAFVEEGNLNKNIFFLRKTLGEWDGGREYIETVPKRGYRFVAPITEVTRGEDCPERDTESGTVPSTVPIRSWSRRAILVSAIAVVSALLVAGVAIYLGSSPRTRINSVAVLPFSNASSDPNAEYLSDGMTEGVIDRLSGLPNLRVISRTSAFRYKRRDIEPQKVAKELGVEALVMGRLIQRGEDVSISVELVDAREDKQLWGEQYSRKLADSTSVPREIATAVSGNLRGGLTSEEKTRLNKSFATNPEAYRLYLKGRYFANQATAAGLKKSIEYFQQAIEKDPGYALAYAGLADSYSGLGGGWQYLPPSDSLPRAKAAGMKAVELDDTLAEAHAALAYAVFFADWDWQIAEREFKRAIELNPNSAVSHNRYPNV